MLFAQEAATDWRSALALILVIAANAMSNWWQNRKPRQLAVKAATKAEHAAVTAEAQAKVTSEEIKAVHSTLNGNGILGTLREVQKGQEEIRAWTVTHSEEDKANFAKVDEKLKEIVGEAKEARIKTGVVVAAVQKGIVITPTAPEAR